MAADYDNYDYPAYWSGRDYEHESEVVAIRAFLQKIPKIKNMADFGCGFGRLVPYYLHRTKMLTLLDPSRKLLAVAKKALDRHKSDWQTKGKKITFVQRKIETINTLYKRPKFDLVIMVRVMHHIVDPKKTIKNISNSINPGGYLILEFANKIHGKALVANFLHGNFTFPIDIFPADRLTAKNKRKKTIPFFNYHPDVMMDILKKQGFKIIEVRSVSNIRSSWAKRNIPISTLVEIEKLLQKPLSKLFFGPSIFILAKKKS